MRKPISYHLAGFSMSLAGSSHISQKKGCDDCSVVERISYKNGKNCLVMVSADGVSHCRYAATASRTVVKTTNKYIKQKLLSGESPSKIMVKSAFLAAVLALREKAAAIGENSLKELGTTLDIAILLEDGRCFVGHSGDGGLLILSRNGKISTTCKINTESGAVYTVDWRSPDGQYAWAIHELRGVACVLMATDGLYDYFTDYGRALDAQFFKKNGIFTGWKTKQQIRRKSIDLQRILSGTHGEKRVTHDDITFVMGGRPALIQRAAAKAKLT